MILFGAIGFGAFVYGKRMTALPPMIIGILLMVYPYFVSGTLLMYLVGAGLCAALFMMWEK